LESLLPHTPEDRGAYLAAAILDLEKESPHSFLSRLPFHDILEGVSFAMQRLVSGAVAVCDEEGAGKDHDRHNRRKNDQP
jgi:hypothetical protein